LIAVLMSSNPCKKAFSYWLNAASVLASLLFICCLTLPRLKAAQLIFGSTLQVKEELLPKLEKSTAENPMDPLKLILGYKSATEILYSDILICKAASALLTSGLRRSNYSIFPKDTVWGKLGKGCGEIMSASKLPGTSPTSTLRLFLRASSCALSWGMVARVASNCASALETSN